MKLAIEEKDSSAISSDTYYIHNPLLNETSKSFINTFNSNSDFEAFCNSSTQNKNSNTFSNANRDKCYFKIQRKSESEENSEEMAFQAKKTRKRLAQATWTRKEEALLFAWGGKQIKKKWDFIAKLIKTKTASQCYYHYNSCNPDIKHKNWSSEEDRKIIQLYRIHGRKWEEIARNLKNRTGKQVRDRFFNKLDKTVNHSKFSDEEDQTILRLYFAYGPSWARIANELGNRSSDMVKSRFYSSIKKRCLKNKNFRKSITDREKDESADNSLQESIQSEKQSLEARNIQSSENNFDNKAIQSNVIQNQNIDYFQAEADKKEKCFFNFNQEEFNSYPKIAVNFDGIYFNSFKNDNSASFFTVIPVPPINSKENDMESDHSTNYFEHFMNYSSNQKYNNENSYSSFTLKPIENLQDENHMDITITDYSEDDN